VDLAARSFDLARPGVTPPLQAISLLIQTAQHHARWMLCILTMTAFSENNQCLAMDLTTLCNAVVEIISSNHLLLSQLIYV